MDGGPDRWPGVADRQRPARYLVGRRQPGHVLDRHLDTEFERLLLAGVDDRHRAIADRAPWRGEFAGHLALGLGFGGADAARDFSVADAGGLRAAKEAGHLIQRTLGGGQPDALRRCLGERRQPLERQHEVDTALGRHQRVNLVHDDRVDRAQRLAGVRCEE